jgi:uncharacterized protein with HEPN domain
MSKDNDKFLLKFILDMINRIEEYILDFEYITKMLADNKSHDATLMCLLQIGETLNKLEQKYKFLDDEDIKGAYEVRNFIAHDYMGVDLGLVEFILRDKLPKLKDNILLILEQKEG